VGEDVEVEIVSLGYRTDLLLLELSGSTFHDTGEYVVIRTPANPGFWWGNYLLYRTPFAPDDTKLRIDDFHREFPAADHIALGIDSVDGEIGAEDELAAAGFTIDRNVVMTADRVLPPQRPNVESTYRFLSGDDDWEQLYHQSLATASMTVDAAYEEFTRRRLAAQRELVDVGHGKWFGAFDGDRLQSSLGLMFDGKGLARFQDVQTSPEDRGRGLATTHVDVRADRGRCADAGDGRGSGVPRDPDLSLARIHRLGDPARVREAACVTKYGHD
jgi:hypothetical protein